jgi:hypothetical protein
MKNFNTITEEQIAKCVRFHSNGKTWYEVPSATTESVYTIRFKGKLPFDNCPHNASTCWHCRAVVIAESRYQAIAREERMNEAKLAAQRELAAFKKFGFQAYQSNAFSLLK